MNGVVVILKVQARLTTGSVLTNVKKNMRKVKNQVVTIRTPVEDPRVVAASNGQ